MKTYCISGIDTDIGKSVVTGLLARFLLERGENVITQKIAQTGCEGISEDILTHRELMGKPIYGVDRSGFTCPFVFPVPASPHLAGELCGRHFEPVVADQATLELEQRFDRVLIEGAGGVMVPLTRELLFIDYLKDKNIPLILVSSTRLGSINHTLLTLDACHHRGIPIAGIVYNCCEVYSEEVTRDSKAIFLAWLKKYQYPEVVIELPKIDFGRIELPDFSPLFSS
jgi:dethiobiotin synthetase